MYFHSVFIAVAILGVIIGSAVSFPIGYRVGIGEAWKSFMGTSSTSSPQYRDYLAKQRGEKK